MATLTVHDFSCLKRITFEVAPVTILIGPQGSGKSVTTKLTYFFYDQLTRQYQSAEKGVDLDDFRKEAARQFRTWFPPSAWGSGKFVIYFSAGLFTARVMRRVSKGTVSDDVAVSFSDFFNTQYGVLVASFSETKAIELDESDPAFRHSLDRMYQTRAKSEASLARALNGEFVNSQTFVPAGRAFFTSIGRLVAAIEQGSSLDPVSIRFAKLFAFLRDRQGRAVYRRVDDDKEQRAQRKLIMTQLFGGEIKFENDLEYVEGKDGRRVPFGALSSGQQELLPMWFLIDYVNDIGVGRRPSVSGDLIYIEEPEAHLFPSAQNLLMDYLIGSVVSRRDNRSLILTTHSPYLLAKLNVYLKAGSLGRQRRHVADVTKVLPRECWLTPSRVRAYAIEGGELVDLIDGDGLIDASYIDEISEDVSRQFAALLDIEYPDAA